MFPGYVDSKYVKFKIRILKNQNNYFRYSHLLISDQGIYMHQQALTDMALCMLERTDIALVTQIPYCKDRAGIWAALEQVLFF
jgi:hypothetical protein